MSLVNVSRRRVGRVVAIAVMLALPWETVVPQAVPASAAIQDAGQDRAVAYAIVGLDGSTSEVVAFDTETGAIRFRLATNYQPDLLVAPTGDLFLLDTTPSADNRATSTLTRRDGRSGTVLASTEIPDRLLYPISGPTTLVLAPDGSRLFVACYKVLGPDTAEDWLAVIDPVSLAVLSTRIPLPGCGASRLATAGGLVVVGCSRTADVRFVDPQTATVIATVDLPGTPVPAGLVADPVRGMVYVVTDDLRIVEIDAATQTVTRTVRTWQRAVRSVPLVDAVAISADDRWLIVGVSAVAGDPYSAVTLHLFALPLLDRVEQVPLPAGFGRFVAAPDGGVFIFPQWGVPIFNGSALTSPRSRPCSSSMAPCCA